MDQKVKSLIEEQMSNIAKEHDKLAKDLMELNNTADNLRLKIAGLAESHNQLARLLVSLTNMNSDDKAESNTNQSKGD